MVYTVLRLATPSLALYKPPLNLVLGGVERLLQAIGSSSSGKQTFSLAVETAEIGHLRSFNASI